MDSGKRGGFFSGRIARAVLTLNNFVILASSVIITALMAYFVRRGLRGRHNIYNLVIGVITLFFYLIAMVLPFIKSYRGYMVPLNWVLSYLWLTSLIFTSQDWSGGRCLPLWCGRKHTVQAFYIIGFVFLLSNTILETLMWATHRRNRVAGDHEKDRPLTTTTGGATTVPTDGQQTTTAAV
ncbi:hypothetical protein N657DRAFT_605239 [Parathielavia appendiculata]|uniref:MARVEL domain-containing protein n=1 Tax=Parathielavia appendiculata TaxID=2587402 RepID=A0AAN6YYP4_9PEZI|nr:hypothetical protein N657DRAFT_605239 [Parathielavia appendiculata]